MTSDVHPGLVAAIGAKVAEHLDAARAELLAFTAFRKQIWLPWMAITTRPATSVTGRITPVMAQSGPRPHRPPGQPTRLVQAMARTPDHPAQPELP